MLVGFGPGTATAVAERFGREGFSVAPVGRNEDRLAAGASALKAQGIDAYPFPADAGDPESIRAAVRSVRAQLGTITILHWNAYGGMETGDLLAADPTSLHEVFDVAVFGLLAATQEALPDLKRDGSGALLVSNGAFGLVSPETDAFVVKLHLMGLALSSAAKHKLVGLLAERLKSEGIYVGEVMVYRAIKGTSPTDGDAVDPSVIADAHWKLYQSRGDTRAVVK
jgi:NAD(P)-dependent dehydrogenase (short-subunit alcohol dehydrogenase family)